MPIPALVVVGSLNMDFVVSVDRLPVARRDRAGPRFPDDPRRQRRQPGLRGGQTGRRRGGRAPDRARGLRRVRRSSEGQPGRGRRGRQRGARRQIAAHRRGADLGGPSRARIPLWWPRAPITRWPRRMWRPCARCSAARSLALFQLETPLDTVAAALALAREEGLAPCSIPRRRSHCPPHCSRAWIS